LWKGCISAEEYTFLPWQEVVSALSDPPSPLQLKKSVGSCWCHGEISQLCTLSLGSSLHFPLWKSRHKNDTLEVTDPDPFSFFSVMLVTLCFGDRGKNFMLCQPEMPKMEKMWPRIANT
jgi:hypothetical protein